MEGIHSGLASFKTINLNWLDREDLAFDVTKVFPEMFSLTEDIAEARSPTHKCREKILHTTKIIRPARHRGDRVANHTTERRAEHTRY